VTAKRTAKWLAIAVGALLATGILAPYLSGDRFRPRIQSALERALGRKVDLGAVHFSLFTGPGFSVDNVVIHEYPAIDLEPVAYVGSLSAVPRLGSLFTGHLEFASIRLDDASINVAKTGGPSESGHWNFETLLKRSVMRAIPEVHVRSGRINFKFGNTKSVFYLTGADLDITPPSRGASDWRVEFSGEPARTDRPAHGFGNFVARGRWVQAGAGRLDVDVRLEPSAVGEIIALVHGYNAGIHGTVSARLRFAGPLDDVRISGSMEVQDVHRWDLMPPHEQGWPFHVAGRLNLPAQTLEVETSSAGGAALPLSVRFRCSNYLSQPGWGVALNWNRFPIGPLLDLARHMGADLAPKLQMTGSLDGALGYSDRGSLQGELDFHEASIAIPDSPPIRSNQARLIFDSGHARLAPTPVRTAHDEQAQIEADYDWAAQSLRLTVSTDAMRVESLREQAGLAMAPWFTQVPDGAWKGQLQYRSAPAETVWTGDIELEDARFPLPGLAQPVEVQSALAHIDGPSVRVDRIRAQAGGIVFEGEYQYQPRVVRPHRLRISIPDAGAAQLERLWMPTLRHSRSLLARALNLGRTPVPDWLSDRHVDATIQIGVLHLADLEARGIQAHLLWDATQGEFDHVDARIGGGGLTGMLSVNLRGNLPAYRLEARLKGIEWKSGTVDTDTVLESDGTGAELLAHLHSTGTFVASGLELDAVPDLETVSGSYDLVLAQMQPVLRFSDLQLVSGTDTYTGQGATQPDGQLLIQLSSGAKEMHMSGTLSQLRLDESQAR